MKDLDYKIGGREFASILLLTLGVKLADTTPTLLFKSAGQSSWMLPLLSMVLMMVSLMFFFPLLKKYKDKGLVQIINLTAGKYLGFAINMMLFLTVFLAMTNNTQSYVDIISGMFYKKTPTLFLMMVFVLTFTYVATRGIDTIGRVAWLVTPYIKINLFVLLLLNWRYYDFTFINPIFGPGIAPILKGGVINSSVFADVIVIAVIYPYIKNHKTFRNMTLISLVVAAIELSVFMFGYVVAFGGPGAGRMSFPFQQFTRMAQIGIGIQHVESLFLVFWIMASVVHFATYLYTASALFTNTLNIKENEPMLLPFAGLAILLGEFIPNETFSQVFRSQMLMIASFSILPLPIFLWGMDKIKGLVHS